MLFFVALLGHAGASNAVCYDGLPGLPEIVGTENDDPALNGTAVGERICGLGGDDTIRGLDGDDYIAGGEGNDDANGNKDDDTVNGNQGSDLVHGGQGNDNVYGGQGNDTVYGDLGDDIVAGDAGNDHVEGGDGNDRYLYHSGNGFDTLREECCDDDSLWLTGIPDPNTARYQQVGNDLVISDGVLDLVRIEEYYSGRPIEHVYFGTPALPLDELSTPPVNTTPYGVFDQPNPWLSVVGWAFDPNHMGTLPQIEIFVDAIQNAVANVGISRPDVIADGLSPNEFVGFHAELVGVTPGLHTINIVALDQVTSAFNVELAGSPRTLELGTEFSDSLTGGPGSDWILGEDGNDIISGDDGDDILGGGEGDDTLYGDDGDDLMNGNQGEDRLNGYMGNDRVYGGKGDDRVRGGVGDDYLFGDLGNDRLWGDTGNDTLEGGPDNDDYFYRPGNGVTIFTDGDDTIEDTEGSNRIFLMRIDSSDVSISNPGDDTLLSITLPMGLSGSIRILGCRAGGGDCLTDGTFEIIYNPTNIIVILADDLGYADLGSYGQQTITTPRLDQMASEGMRFTDFYSGAPSCAPSRSTLFSGLHTGHSAIRSNSSPIIEPQDATLSIQLQTRGYATGAFGKWGLASGCVEVPGTICADPDPIEGLPHLMGFDRFTGLLSHVDAHVAFLDSPLAAPGTAVHPYNARARQVLYETVGAETVPLAVSADRYLHDEFISRARGFITQHTDEPFFLYLPITIPHAELAVPDGVLTAEVEPTLAGYDAAVADPTPWLPPQNGGSYQRDNVRPNATYAAMISRLDRDVGELLDLVDSQGLDDSTVVMFTSDNGPHSAGGMLRPPDVFDSNGIFRGGTPSTANAGGKFTLWEGGIRVPMIVRWPNTVPAGATTSEPTAMWDIVPTVAEIVGAPAPPGVDGLSLLPLLEGQSQTPHDFLYWEMVGSFPTVQAVRQGSWKAVRLGDGSVTDTVELYDLASDPGETCNVVNSASACFDAARYATLNQLMQIMNAQHVTTPGYASITPLIVDPLLTVTKSGTGEGVVVGLGIDIDCGNTCFALLAVGTDITLSLVADPGSELIAWSGACTGANPCNFTITGDIEAAVAVPEPSLVMQLMAGAAFVALAELRRKKRRRAEV